MRRRLLGFMTLLALSGPVLAQTHIAISPGMTQAQFNNFSEDLGAVLSYRDLAPPVPLGSSGIDFGVGGSDTSIQHPGSWQAATHDSSTSVFLPTLYLSKGLPLGIDIGGTYTALPNSNIHLLGAQISYALLQGGSGFPALALRATYTRLSGVNQLSFSTRGLELSLSQSFGRLTPYAGVGRVRVDSDPNGVGGLAPQTFYENKGFVGADINLGALNLAIEGDRIGGNNSVSAKIGVRF